jgi:hypothetical protein
MDEFATNVPAVVGITATSATKFWGAAFAGAGSSHSTIGLSPQAVLKKGLLSSTPVSAITTCVHSPLDFTRACRPSHMISQHHYSESFCSGSEGLLQDLMAKSTIRGNFSAYIPDISAVRAQGLNHVFGETSSYSCHVRTGSFDALHSYSHSILHV